MVPTRGPGRPPLDDDDDADSVQVCVRLPSTVYNDAFRRSKQDGVSVPEVIRRDMREAQKRYQK
jgi:hypothetical protein